MPLPTEEEILRMHRYFAIECNNNAWELAELPTRTPEQRQEMLSLAEVAAWHWSKAGTPINFARADMLLGWVCCLVGWASDARVYTDRVHEQLRANPDGINTWDTAFVGLLEAHTRSAEKDQSALDAAVADLDGLREPLDEGDRQVLDQFRTRITA